MIFDCAVIGTGPAGVSAALNLKIREKSFIWLGSKNLSDKIGKAERISNYPGFINVSGLELADAFKAQVDEMEIEIKEEMVNNIIRFSDHFALSAGSEFYEAKTVILTTGTAKAAQIEGEERLLGRGVSYCATCDGNLYKGKTIAVICENKRFEDEVRYLAGLAGKIYLFTQYESGFKAENTKNLSSKPVEVCGEERVSALKLKDGDEVIVSGVFFLRDSVALSYLLPKLETEGGHIKVNRQMETNIPGVFAAGDCTGRPYQYAKAVGEGNVAAHSVFEYLAEMKEEIK